MNKPMSDSKSFEVLTASPVRLSSSPARSYRSWSDEEKARIVGETLVAGGECVGDCAVKWAGSVATFCVASQGEWPRGGCAIGRSAEPAGQVHAL